MCVMRTLLVDLDPEFPDSHRPWTQHHPSWSESASALQRDAPTDWVAAWGAGVGAAEDFPIKAGIPRSDELVSLSHRQESHQSRLQLSSFSLPQPGEAFPPAWSESRSMVLMTEAPTRMSRTDEVHRITENVYKVRGLMGVWRHLLLWGEGPRISLTSKIILSFFRDKPAF